MKALLDTNVLIAGLVEGHQHHERAFPWLDQALGGTPVGAVNAHGLAEAYSVLTGYRIHGVSPTQAEEALAAVSAALVVVELSVADYRAAIRRVAGLSLPGGGIYDALHAQAALKAGVDALLTFNPKHFTRLGDDVAALVREP